MSKKVIIALGGNALERKDLPPTAESQLEVCKETVKHIADIIEQGYQVVVSHGNGPQVGRILLASEGSAEITPSMPFDVCGAMSQGYIGYHLQQTLGQELQARGINKPVVSLVTQMVVDANDEAFQNLTKPVGPFYTEEEAKKLEAEKGYTVKEDSGRGYRRVVASPKPKKVVELDAIKTLVEAGAIVIASGGGGIPVIEKDGKLQGVPAVIDKDFATAKLAEDLDMDSLVILTDVPKACINFRKENQEEIGEISTTDMQKHVDDNQFAPGAMLPKVQASMGFADSRKGRKAIISSLNNAKGALKGETGTIIVNN